MSTVVLSAFAGMGIELAKHRLNLRGLIGGTMAACAGISYGYLLKSKSEINFKKDGLSKQTLQQIGTYLVTALIANLVANALIHLFAAQLSLWTAGALVCLGAFGLRVLPTMDSIDYHEAYSAIYLNQAGLLASAVSAVVGCELIGAIFSKSLSAGAAAAATSLGVGFAGTVVALIVGAISGYIHQRSASAT